MVQDQGENTKTMHISTERFSRIAPIKFTDSPYTYQVSEFITLTDSYSAQYYLLSVDVSVINDGRYAYGDVFKSQNLPIDWFDMVTE